MDEEPVHESSAFQHKLLSGLKALRDSGKLFDFGIHVDGQTFKAHKAVLVASGSGYFKGMLLNDNIESLRNEVTIEETSALAVGTIIEFIYSGKLHVTESDVSDVLLASILFQIEEVENYCVEFLKRRLTVSNCLRITDMADRCNIADLYDKGLKVCLNNFSDIHYQEDFEKIDLDLLKKLISHDELNVFSEDEVILAIENWISVDDSRKDHLDDLMRNVRFNSIPVTSLVDFETHDFFLNSELCKSLLNEAKNYLLLRDHYIPSFNLNPRDPVSRRRRIYAVGGWSSSSNSISEVERYDQCKDKWESVRPMKTPRCGAGLAFYKSSLYAIGGHDGFDFLKSVERYDIVEGDWFSDVADMNQKRTSVNVVQLGDHIYAIGGQSPNSESKSTDTCERYDPKEDKWEIVDKMNTSRMGAGAAVLGSRIFVLGGENHINVNRPFILNSVEIYDPSTGKWTDAKPMRVARKHFGCASLDGKIYVVGGGGSNWMIHSCECYDLATDTWTDITPISEPRRGIGLAQLHGLIYASGGYDGKNKMNVVEAYNPCTRSWTRKAPMIVERLGGGLVVSGYMD